MNRQEKIELLQGLASGKLKAGNLPKEHFIFYEDDGRPGIFTGGKAGEDMSKNSEVTYEQAIAYAKSKSLNPNVVFMIRQENDDPIEDNSEGGTPENLNK